MSTSIQNNVSPQNLDNSITEDLKNINTKDKIKIAGAVTKYAIANFLNEKTGGKFSLLRNWEANSAKHLLKKSNAVFSPILAKRLQNTNYEIQNKIDEKRNLFNNSIVFNPIMKHSGIDHALLTTKVGLEYGTNLLTHTSDKQPSLQTLNHLLLITGTLYQENKNLKPIIEATKTKILESIFSPESIKQTLSDLNLPILAKPANALITFFGIQNKVDKFIIKYCLENPDHNLNKKQLKTAEEILLYKGLSLFADCGGGKLSDEKIKEFFKNEKDPALNKLLEQYETLKNLYQESKVMRLGNKFLRIVLSKIHSGSSFDIKNLKALVSELDKSLTNTVKYTDIVVNKAKETGDRIVEIGKEAIDVVQCKNIINEKEMEDKFLSTESAQELQALLDECDEPTKALVNESEDLLKEDIKESMEQIQPETLPTEEAEALPELTLSDLQKDFIGKDDRTLLDKLNIKVEDLDNNAKNLKNDHPVEDKGWTWTATYHLSKTFQNMLYSEDVLNIKIKGQDLEYNEDATDIVKEKVIKLNNTLLDNLKYNVNRTDGTSIVKTLSFLADENTLSQYFIPKDLKDKFEASGLDLGTYEKTRQLPDTKPNITLNVTEDDPMRAEIEVTWPLLDKNNQPEHTFGLKFTTTLDLTNNAKTIETSIAGISDLQYRFDGTALILPKNEVDQASLAG